MQKSSEKFEPRDADLQEAYEIGVLQEAARILKEENDLRYEAAIHGLKYLEESNETK